jgi:hypothetical protein
MQGGLDLGLNGDANLLVQNGGTVAAPRVRARSTSQFTGSKSTIQVRGGGSRLSADDLTMSGSSSTLEVGGGGHVALRYLLDMGNAALNLSGGSIDVGTLVGLPETGFVRVGPFGSFYSAGSIANVHNYGGNVHAGSSPGVMTVTGDYLQEPGGLLSFSIAGTTPGQQYSQLAVGGNLQLGGKIRVSFEDGFAPVQGQTFDLITVAGTSQLTGVQLEIGNLAPGFFYSFAPFGGGYRLTALANGQFVAPSPGDFNGDGMVDGFDLSLWGAGFGATDATPKQGDADGDLDADGVDFLSWQRQFGRGSAVVLAGAALPEPTSLVLLFLALLATYCRRRIDGWPTRSFCGTDRLLAE